MSYSEENDKQYNHIDIEFSNLFFPLIKLVVQKNKQTKLIDETKSIDETNTSDKLDNFVDFEISSFAVKLNEGLDYEKNIESWELYWVKNIQSDEFVKAIKIDKTICSSNIIEKLIEMSL